MIRGVTGLDMSSKHTDLADLSVAMVEELDKLRDISKFFEIRMGSIADLLEFSRHS